MSEPDAGAPVVNAPLNAIPGGKSNTVCAGPAPCSTGYHGEFDDEYRGLNGRAMPDLLDTLTAMDRDHMIALRAHVGSAPDVFVGRLMVAMDAVYYRGNPMLFGIGVSLVNAEMDTFQIEYDQRTAVTQYMQQPRPKTAAAPAPAAAASGGTPFPDSQLKAYGSDDETAFKKKVYNAHVASAKARGRVFHADFPASDLASVEGQQMQTDAAAACLKLLAQARADLATAQAAAEELAVAATAIAPGSGYRSSTVELSIWESLFDQYYKATSTDRKAATDGEFGDAAVKIMVNYYSGRKAAPGFGNHTNGIAMDFNTTQGGTGLGQNTSQNAKWVKSWFHIWLVAHAVDFHFTPLATEAWHWEYHP